jgi:tRNA pseudouridine13 synthase
VGVPNAFGEQRFGRDKDNADRALAWLTNKERAPRDARLRRLQYSALQSAVFNAVLEERVARGDWNVPLEGDVLKKEDSGGLFLCTNVQEDRERAARWELSPTGPIFGVKMNQPAGEPAEIEARAFAKVVTAELDLNALRSLGEGTRRPLRLPVKEVTATPDRGEEPCGCVVEFVLPKGAFATTVVGQIIQRREEATSTGSELTQPPTPTDDEP